MPENEKCMVIFQPSGRRGYVEKGKTLKEASVSLGVDIEGICGEKAICGKCKVRVEEGIFEKYGIESYKGHLSEMGPTEKKFFNLPQLEQGFRLACQAKVTGDVIIFVPEESRMGKQIVRKAAREIDIALNPAVKKYMLELPPATLEDNTGDWERLQKAIFEQTSLTDLRIDYQALQMLQDVVRQGEWKVTVSIWQEKEVIKVEPGRNLKSFGLAVDVGTTTIAGYLCDLTNGKLVTTASMMNPQVIYGEDVMSRICYTMTNPDGLRQLNQAIIDGLNGIVTDVAAQSGIRRQDIVDMTIVGNTCMHHIFLNINPVYIGKAPFPPALHHSIDIKARDWGLKIPPEEEKVDKGSYPPCQVACPAQINGQDLLYLIAQGKFAEALDEVRLATPFAGVLGRVCTHPCEIECERGKVDEPLSIRLLHRFAADKELEKPRKASEPVASRSQDEVAVIGSGPAGLSCAYELVRRGYPVTVFEKAAQPGGMLRYGIPDYRLPKNILDGEIDYIKNLGVKIKTDSHENSISSLFESGFKAIFIATGAWLNARLDIPGTDSAGVLYAIDFLKQVNSGQKVEMAGKKVAVIGGGNAAIDAARSAARKGASSVTILYRRSRDEMPAIKQEIEEALKEGIKLEILTAPVEIVSDNKRITAVKCIRTELGEPDESGRARPVPVEGSEFSVETDSVIIATGQAVEKVFPEIDYRENGTIAVDNTTLQTSIEKVFAGGDAVVGPLDVISAVCDGQKAAISIELMLEDVDMVEGRPKPLKRVPEIPKEGVGREERYPARTTGLDERNGFAEVELGFDSQNAQCEAKRCLNCSVFAEPEDMETPMLAGGIKISPGAYIHVLPIEAGFVGADNVGVLIAEEPYKQDLMELIIDIGTNGELILGNRQRLISSSCATGPAFEGAEIRYGMRAAPGAIEKIEIDRQTKEPRYKVIGREEWNTELDKSEIGAKGICGSGIIDIVPQLFLAGIVDRTGRFAKDLDTPRLREIDGEPEFVIAWEDETSIGQDVVICQQDIRAIQLAKGAMYAGAKIMMRTLGIEKLDKVILAGAFGSYIDKMSAAILGLFPDCEPENIYSVGNAAGDGARMALLNTNKRKEADEMARRVEYIELTLAPDFDKVFAQAMWLPHMKDKFPHLENLLPAKS